jgi:hypothetical protein
MAARAKGGEEREELRLSEAAKALFDECRMVLPGIQATFGFQLVAVFNNRFAESLDSVQQHLHLAAMALVACAAALVMTPAAIHRYHGPREITSGIIELSSVLLLVAMPLLAVGVALDFYLIASLILAEGSAMPVALAIFAVMIFLWVILPRLMRARSRRHSARSEPDA